MATDTLIQLEIVFVCLSVGLFSINNHFSKRFWLINRKILADENLLFLVSSNFIHDLNQPPFDKIFMQCQSHCYEKSLQVSS